MEELRQQQRQSFLNLNLGSQDYSCIALPGDASFRRYYRVLTGERPYMLMDAPPKLEDCHGFVLMGTALCAHGIRAPQILAQDLVQGFLLLEDFGDTLLAQVLDATSATQYYHACFEPLLRLQALPSIAGWDLPRFDQSLLMAELTQCREWFLEKFLGVKMDGAVAHCLEQTFGTLQQEIQTHPQVVVHRDYHSRNLMLLANGDIGVLDFQDAVTGSITYDLVSLLRDCYVVWPHSQVQAWVADFYARLPADTTFSLAQFQRWFDWQGLQRHLKCLFIFARKWLRDGSKNYLADLPTTFTYVETVAYQYPEFALLAGYLPAWREKMQQAIAAV